MSDTSSPAFSCSTPGCTRTSPTALSCPTCLSLGLPPSKFCSQECFKGYWKEHNLVHKEAKARMEFKPPAFDYTGPLRPHYVTPMRSVPSSVAKPDYWATGIPESEMKSKGSNTIYINNKKEIEGIRAACAIGRAALDLAHSLIRPGITTEEIDVKVHDYIVSRGAYPSPLNYHGFPKSCCTSVNEIICHGIPDARPLAEGDIVNVDVSVYYNGFHGDLNETYPVGKIDEASKKLIKATYDSLELAMKAVQPGTMVREFGEIITKFVTKQGFSVVRTYCGHGVGALFHSAPNVPHYNKNKAVGVLKPGMVFTIEPMINAGTWRDVTWLDDWTSATQDGKRSAQFEHTLLVTETGFENLTARTKDSPPFFWETEEKEKTQENK